MEKLIKAVKAEIKNEYARACEQFGPVTNSDWESYAIMLEEAQETADEMTFALNHMTRFWSRVKDKKGTDEQKLDALRKVENHAMLAACEAIQVAAMAYKAQLTIQQRSVK